MNKINLRLYGSLNNTLPITKRQITFPVFLENKISLLEILETLNVAVNEIDLILANGKAIHFNYIPDNNDRISVYPRFENIDITPLNLCHRGTVH
ncbi:MAG: hypothetical protein MI865_06380 [Proteobacteria bacterium]|nr:hypothetical protein [Pseudomonadota bacterium]